MDFALCNLPISPVSLFPLIFFLSYYSVSGSWIWVFYFLLSVAGAMDETDVETITNQAKNFSWLKGKVNLAVVPSSKESSKRLLIGKILSKKFFPKTLVKEILVKAWNLINDFEVALVDKNVFVFSFNHEADVRRAWDRRPWLLKGEHLILKRFSPD